jgi:hypothetical protein
LVSTKLLIAPNAARESAIAQAFLPLGSPGGIAHDADQLGQMTKPLFCDLYRQYLG